MKKTFFAIALFFQLAAIAGIATADSPYPDCFPCPRDASASR